MSKAKTTNAKAPSKAEIAAARAKRDNETEEEHAARLEAMDKESGAGAEDGPDDDGRILVRALSGFTFATGISAAQIELQRPLRPGETPEQHQARMAQLDKVKPEEPTVIRRGSKFRVHPDEAAKLAAMGLVLIGDSDEFLGDIGPKVLTEAGLIQQSNG